MASYDVFTPPGVSAKMKSYLPERIERLLEPSVGTGDLLRAFDGAYDRADVYDINSQYLDAIPENPRITKTHGNFLDQTVEPVYDAVVMNPPYQRYQDMSLEMRRCVRNVSDILRAGNIDLYVAFLVKCIHLLKPTGTLVAITPSTWLYNKSASRFRNWLFDNQLVAHIHDYGSEKVFPGIDVYCCILVVTPGPKEFYTRNGARVQYSSSSENVDGKTLQDVCELQNGIATLCDGVFIHDVPLYPEQCWKPILKVSKNKIRSIIFPYREDGTIIPEDHFRRQNPQTYAYLLRNREALENRDKGNKKYEAWYAFGRRQGLRIPDQPMSVYISTLCAPELPTICAPTALFYSGIRMTPTATSCENIQTSIAENRESILQSCSKRSSNWVNITTSGLRRCPASQ